MSIVSGSHDAIAAADGEIFLSRKFDVELCSNVLSKKFEIIPVSFLEK